MVVSLLLYSFLFLAGLLRRSDCQRMFRTFFLASYIQNNKVPG